MLRLQIGRRDRTGILALDGDLGVELLQGLEGQTGKDRVEQIGDLRVLAQHRFAHDRCRCEDDKGAQVVYAPAPVVREAVLQQHPEIAKLLDPVFATLTLETLQQLNAKIAVEGEDAGAVAAAYLKSKHFLP